MVSRWVQGRSYHLVHWGKLESLGELQHHDWHHRVLGLGKVGRHLVQLLRSRFLQESRHQAQKLAERLVRGTMETEGRQLEVEG